MVAAPWLLYIIYAFLGKKNKRNFEIQSSELVCVYKKVQHTLHFRLCCCVHTQSTCMGVCGTYACMHDKITKNNKKWWKLFVQRL